MSITEAEFSHDLLDGAAEIAAFLGLSRRRVYHLVGTSNFPAFRMGAKICARRSVLRGWVEEQEARNSGKRPRRAA
jgi:excisionase family DNA binding protein